MKKIKFSGAGLSISKACILGTVISAILLIALAMVAAIFISNEYFDVSASRYFAGISQFLGVFIGCLTAGKLTKETKVATCAITAGGCIFVQLVADILIFDGISNSFLLNLLTILTGCGCAILLCVNNKNRSVSKRRRIHSR